MKTDDKRYLCHKCAGDYKRSGFKLRLSYDDYCKNDYYGTCEICNWHEAHEYVVSEYRQKPK